MKKVILFLIVIIVLPKLVSGAELSNDYLSLHLDEKGTQFWHLNIDASAQGEDPHDLIIAKEEFFVIVDGGKKVTEKELRAVSVVEGEKMFSVRYVYKNTTFITKTYLLNRDSGVDVMYDIYNNGSFPVSFFLYEYADLDIPFSSETGGAFIYYDSYKDHPLHTYLSCLYNDADDMAVSDFGNTVSMVSSRNVKKGIVFDYASIFGNSYADHYVNTAKPYLWNIYLSSDYFFAYNGFTDHGFNWESCDYSVSVNSVCRDYPEYCYSALNTTLFQLYPILHVFADEKSVYPFCFGQEYSCNFLTSANEIVHDFGDECGSHIDHSRMRKDLKDPKLFSSYDISLGAFKSEHLLIHFDYDFGDTLERLKFVDLIFTNVSASSFTISNVGDGDAPSFDVTVFNDMSWSYSVHIDSLGAGSSKVFFIPPEGQNSSRLFFSADVDNAVPESDEMNNLASIVLDRVKVRLVVDAASSDVIGKYVKDSLTDVEFVDEGEDITVRINVSNECGYGYCRMDGYIDYYGNDAYEDFVGIVAGVNGTVYVYGVGLSGTLAAVKEFSSDYKYYFSSSTPTFLRNVDGVAMYDYIVTHNISLNEKVYRCLHNIYDVDEMHFISNKGTLLRVVNMKGNLGRYWEKPVVLAGGLWNNISVFEDFGSSLANSGHDVFLIEITGGPYTDCQDCVNYDFDDLSTDVFPALIGGVQSLRNMSTLQYVGYSNGGRTALVSLEKYNEDGLNHSGFYYDGVWKESSMTAHPIDTFVGVAVPGSFEGKGVLHEVIGKNADITIERLRMKNITHLSFGTAISEGILNWPHSDSDARISLNLLSDYLYSIKEDTDPQIGQGLNFNTFGIIQGTQFLSHDLIVTVEDEAQIYNNTGYNKRKAYLTTPYSHLNIITKDDTYRLVKRIINNQKFSVKDKNSVLDEERV